MASEMRRLAMLLPRRRAVSFPSDFDPAASRARLRAALAQPGPVQTLRGEAGADRTRLFWGRASGRGVRCTFEGTWTAGPEGARLAGEFTPTGSTLVHLKAASLVLTLLMAASAYVLLASEIDATARVLTPITFILATLVFPFVVTALGSAREDEEARIARALRRLLTSAEESLPDRPPPSVPRTQQRPA